MSPIRFTEDPSSNKRRIVTSFFYLVSSTIPELAKELNLSVPTVTKALNELVDEGIVVDYGKSETKFGRKPNTFGLNPMSGYFCGIDIKRDHLNIGICNFKGEIVRQDFDIPYHENYENQKNSVETLDEICTIVNSFIDSSGIERSKILNTCASISGRVNSSTGFSYSVLTFSETPVSELLSDKLGIKVCIENDSRAMTYGEYVMGVVKSERDVLFVNLGWGLGMGIIVNGRLYQGKSGFAGELGHTIHYNNEILCHCGKRGCLETEVSGMALHREIINQICSGKASCLSERVLQSQPIGLSDIIEAVNAEDVLCIELIEEIGMKLGKELANMINIFNPELLVVGGTLSEVGDCLLQPIKQTIKKYSLRLVHGDTKIVCSRLGAKAGVIGACMIARHRMFEQLD